MSLYSKAFYVVTRCETLEQCNGAIKYLCLAASRLDDEENKNLHELWEIQRDHILRVGG